MTAARYSLIQILLYCLGLAAFPVGAVEVYRWTDDNGQVHFGQRPPATGSSSKISVPDGPASPPTADPSAVQRREKQQRLLDAYAYERGQRKAAEQRDAREKHENRQRCRALRSQWQRLAYAGPIYVKRADGGRIYLSDEQRRAEQDALRPSYVRYCGESP